MRRGVHQFGIRVHNVWDRGRENERVLAIDARGLASGVQDIAIDPYRKRHRPLSVDPYRNQIGFKIGPY